MRTVPIFLLLAASAPAQVWEAGVLGGGGIYRNATYKAASGATAKAGFAAGPAFGGYLDQHLYSRLSGEIRYLYQKGDLKVSSGGGKATFRGDTHAIHYDMLLHPGKADASWRPYLAAGAGFKRYSGTGLETMTQPLSQFALLTQTEEWKPLVSVGAGAVMRAGKRGRFRIDARDYMTPLPHRVVAPSPGVTAGGWLHDFVVTAGFGVVF